MHDSKISTERSHRSKFTSIHNTLKGKHLNQCIELLLLSRVVYICFLLLNGAAARDKVYQLLAHGRWFSPGTPASSTTKTGRHNIAEILLKVALNTITQIKSLLNTIKWF